MRLRINEEYQNLVPALTEREYQSLKQSIKDNGQAERGINQKIGKTTGLSHETVRRVEIILQSNNDDLIEKAGNDK